MEIEAFVQKKKQLYFTLLKYIDTTGEYQEEFNSLIQVIENQDILHDREETLNLFRLISKIEENHHRTTNFYDKFEQIFNHIINENKFSISCSEIFQIYKNSKRMLYLLLDKHFLIPDEPIIKQLLKMRDQNGFKYSLYLYLVLKPYINETEQQKIEKLITMSYDKDIDNFDKKCQIGENDSPICSIIRQDSIDDFKTYVEANQLPLTSKIERSIFESNIYLTSIDIKPSLIEYAAFFGSIQIIQYLLQNNGELTGQFWYFAIHSNNSEVIQICEENKIDTKIDQYEDLVRKSRWYQSDCRSEYEENMRLLRETVKCHHNEIYDMVRKILLSQELSEEIKYSAFIKSFIEDLFDYYFYPNDICELISMKKKIDYHGCTLSFLSSSLSKITIPDSVTKIGNNAFYGCSSVREILIPNSVTKIGKDSFANCSSLIELTIPDSVIKIGNNAFKGCLKLTKIEIPSSVTKIGDNCFDGCVSLFEIEIPSSCSLLGNYVFNNCKALQKVEIPDSVQSFGDFCFCNCSSLKQIEISSNVVSIGKNCFYGCKSLSSVIIPVSVERINEYSFFDCSSLKSVVFETPSSVSAIDCFAFSRCGLDKIDIPSSVTEIGNSAFADCQLLKKVAVPSSVKYIGVDAFSLGTKVV